MTETLNTKPFYNNSIPDDWEIRELKEFSRFYSGGTPLTTKSDFYQGQIPFIKSGEIYFEETEQFISEEALMKSSAKMVSKGDLLYALYGANSGEVAISKIDGAINQAILCIKLSGSCNTVYVYNYLLLEKERVIKKFLQGGQGNLSAKIVKSIKIPLPPLPEQRAIAKALSLMDTAINKNNQLIAQKQLRKKWLMQNLLTGKKRLKGFRGEWKTLPLKEILILASRPVDKPNGKFLALGIRSHGKGTFLKPDFDPDKIAMDTLYVVKENDLIVNITFAWEGAIAISKQEDDGALVSHRFPTFNFNFKTGVVNYFRHLILQPRFRYLLELISPGGAGRNRVLSKKDFLKLEVTIPEVEEQTAIAKVLQAADKEIALLKAKTENLREQKKWMMQVLLTGKKRLKVDKYA